MTFKDHFSRQAADYSRFRPGYPAGLIAYVAAQAPERRLAIDCATGSGQAAVALADHFATVVGLDGSVSQLVHAERHPRVSYVAAVAERLPVAAGRASLVAAAQAIHWFDFGRFYAECRRVLVPGGVLAAWTYGKFSIAPDVDAVVDHFYEDVVGPYWPPERRYVEEGYRTLPFPWHESATPDFALDADWNLEQVLGYLATWSAVQRYRDQRGADPLPDLRDRLVRAWSTETPRRVRWPLHLRLGYA
jgi:SAM-dependent methyltransferase